MMPGRMMTDFAWLSWLAFVLFLLGLLFLRVNESRYGEINTAELVLHLRRRKTKEQACEISTKSKSSEDSEKTPP